MERKGAGEVWKHQRHGFPSHRAQGWGQWRTLFVWRQGADNRCRLCKLLLGHFQLVKVCRQQRVVIVQ